MNSVSTRRTYALIIAAVALIIYLKRKALQRAFFKGRSSNGCKNCYCVPKNAKLEPRETMDKLAGSVKMYKRHLFIAAEGLSTDWSKKMENETVFKTWQKLLKVYPGWKTTAFDIKDSRCIPFPGIDIQVGDLLLFPENLHFRVTEEKRQEFVEALGDSEKLEAFGEPEILPGRAVFVCGHNTRDNRCGIFGTQAYEVCKEILPDNGALFLCSHIGGHVFAPNILISSRKEKVIDYFGLVPRDAIPTILHSKTVPLKYWRGRQGLKKEEVKRMVQNKEVIPM